MKKPKIDPKQVLKTFKRKNNYSRFTRVRDQDKKRIKVGEGAFNNAYMSIENPTNEIYVSKVPKEIGSNPILGKKEYTDYIVKI